MKQSSRCAGPLARPATCIAPTQSCWHDACHTPAQPGCSWGCVRLKHAASQSLKARCLTANPLSPSLSSPSLSCLTCTGACPQHCGPAGHRRGARVGLCGLWILLPDHIQHRGPGCQPRGHHGRVQLQPRGGEGGGPCAVSGEGCFGSHAACWCAHAVPGGRRRMHVLTSSKESPRRGTWRTIACTYYLHASSPLACKHRKDQLKHACACHSLTVTQTFADRRS